MIVAGIVVFVACSLWFWLAMVGLDRWRRWLDFWTVTGLLAGAGVTLGFGMVAVGVVLWLW